jgi:hypothetical protein
VRGIRDEIDGRVKRLVRELDEAQEGAKAGT